ncbi:MAG: hypothetical protein K5866_00910 [Treponema sp.]|nr:hypothetical protein [Treponema sp.]
MAKDFDQYDDNPVMKTLRDAAEEQKQISDANSILKSANPVQTQIVEEKTSVENNSQNAENAGPVEQKKILMNISIRESTKKSWKMFFLEHDLSMTQGIETAVEYLMSEVSKGNIRLSKGGITK